MQLSIFKTLKSNIKNEFIVKLKKRLKTVKLKGNEH